MRETRRGSEKLCKRVCCWLGKKQGERKVLTGDFLLVAVKIKGRKEKRNIKTRHSWEDNGKRDEKEDRGCVKGEGGII